jgi:dCMP deaminase
MDKIIIAYIPVLHQGYLHFLERHSDATRIYLIGQEFLDQVPQLRKDIRALKPEQMVEALRAVKITAEIKVLSQNLLEDFPTNTQVILPDEDISHFLVEKFLPQLTVQFDTTFLRWDHQKSLSPSEVKADDQVSHQQLQAKFLEHAAELAKKSADWWRQVGGVIAKDGKEILTAFNHHVPSQLEPYYNGDPRGNFHKGDHIELSTALHAEAGLIAQAAQKGISLEGTQLYVTTFPCPNCAKLVAYSGIKEVYFTDGYAMVDGESIMKARGVRLIKVA